jgi:hypothetical protein
MAKVHIRYTSYWFKSHIISRAKSQEPRAKSHITVSQEPSRAKSQESKSLVAQEPRAKSHYFKSQEPRLRVKSFKISRANISRAKSSRAWLAI